MSNDVVKIVFTRLLKTAENLTCTKSAAAFRKQGRTCAAYETVH